jgi:hypothetical protein
MLNNNYILNFLARKFLLDECNSLNELIEKYDKKNLTQRCYNYWSLTDCILWDLKKGCNIFDILAQYPKCEVNWDLILRFACDIENYDLIEDCFASADSISITDISKMVSKNLHMVICINNLIKKYNGVVNIEIYTSEYGYWYIHLFDNIGYDKIYLHWCECLIIKNSSFEFIKWLTRKISKINNETTKSLLCKSVTLTGNKEFIIFLLTQGYIIKFKHIIQSGNENLIYWTLNNFKIVDNVVETCRLYHKTQDLETFFSRIPITGEVIKAVLLSGNTDLLRYFDNHSWQNYVPIRELIDIAIESNSLSTLKAVYCHENIKTDLFDYHTTDSIAFDLLMDDKKFDLVSYLHQQTDNKTDYLNLNWDFFDAVDCLGHINNLTVPDLKWIMRKFCPNRIPWSHLLTSNLQHGSPELLECIVKNSTKWEFVDGEYRLIYNYLMTQPNRYRWIKKLLGKIDELK